MPTNRKRTPRSRVVLEDPQWMIDYLLTGHIENGSFERFGFRFCCDTNVFGRPTPREVWHRHRDDLLQKWIADHPGTRPCAWWKFESLEPRRRLGGIGTPQHECLAVKGSFTLGIPDYWVTPWQESYYNGKALDIHGRNIGEYSDGAFPYKAIDPGDPPTFESQAAYLKRHGFLTNHEEKRLSDADFMPEIVIKD